MRRIAAAAACAAMLWTGAGTGTAEAADRPGLISFGVGQFDTTAIDTGSAGGFFDIGDRAGRGRSPEFRLEYRFAQPLWKPAEWFAVRPFVGGATTGDAMVYGLGGVLLEFEFGNFVFTPGFGAGLWTGGDGKDLGYPLQFRTMFEVGYRFENQVRATVGFSHMSNADLDGTNPGANSLMVYLHMPTTFLIGR